MALRSSFVQGPNANVGHFKVETPTGEERVTVIQDNYGSEPATVLMYGEAEIRVQPPLSGLSPFAASLAELMVSNAVVTQE